MDRDTPRAARRTARSAGTELARPAREDDRSLYYLTWLAIAALTLALHLWISDEIAFADAVQYLTYVDNLYFYRANDWFIFEPFSKLMLLLLRGLSQNTESTVAIAHYIISAVYLLGTLAIFPPSRGNWRGLIMAFALYGSQLAFVTIRATPAYIVASIATMQAVDGRRRAFLFAALAIMFHVSSVLALIPILALFFKSKIPSLSFFQRPKVLFFSLLFIFGLFGLAGSAVFSITKDLFDNIPFLGKYLVFAVGYSDVGGVNNIVNSFALGHFVLLIAITVFTIAFLLLDYDATRSTAIFVIVSYVFYVFTFFAFSPIAAFRQTPFWVLPAFSIFPWERVGWRGIGQVLFLILAAGMLLFQFSRVV